jgi:beta-N-acetylhexosaminidase
MIRKAIILGINGISLTKTEASILKNDTPWGIILFSRNIDNYYQLKSLISNIKNKTNDKNYPVFIDQEGGSVSRLNKLVDFSMFSQKFFGQLFLNNKKIFLKHYKNYIERTAIILNDLGININTVPVLDIYRKSSHKMMSDRSYSQDHKVVTKLGNLCIDLYKKNKIATVMKHIPGHGLSKLDSHYDLPIIKNKKKYLMKNDFAPFKNCKSNFAMTAHIVYKSFDPNNTATHSKIIINNVIRKYIGFNGILISDDISMKALKYKLTTNAIKSLEAGCNLVLHCNGSNKEMIKLLTVIPKIDNFTQKKTSQFTNFLG